MLTPDQCYRILNLHPQASPHQLRQAYLTLAKQWHPDRHRPEAQAAAAHQFRQIQSAYKHLKQHLNDPSPDPITLDSIHPKSQPLTSNELYQSAVILGQQGSSLEAIAELSRAIRINPNHAEAYQYRGYLNEQLGFDHRAASDLSQAARLKRSKSTPPFHQQQAFSTLEQEFVQVKQKVQQRTHSHNTWSAIAKWMLVTVTLCLSLSTTSLPHTLRPDPVISQSHHR